MKKFLQLRFKVLILICCTFSLLQGCKEEHNIQKPSFEGTLFELVPSDSSGVNFVNVLPETPRINILTYQYLHNGAGVSIGDINNDGLQDIFFSANYGPNHLYLNKGDLRFEEIGRQAGIGGRRGWSTGSTMVDINQDGFLDIYVCRSGDLPEDKRRNALFVNNGDATFTDRASEFGLDDAGYSSHATFFDYDKDGDLDMFLLNHAITPVNGDNLYDVLNKRNELAGDKLFRNDNGNFVDVSEAAGIIGNSIGYGLSVSVGDINNDSWPDLYVSNDYLERDYLYINNTDGSFSEKIKESTRHISNFSMGSDMADFNNDGWLDIMVVDMVAEDNFRIKTNMSGMNPKRFFRAVDNGFHYQYMMNTLQLNNGNQTFSEVAQLAGVSNTDWSWAPLWADFDNDGKQDLFITNGLRKDARNNDFVIEKKKLLKRLNESPGDKKQILRAILDSMPEQKIKNYIYKNEGELAFSNKQEDWGFEEVSFSSGAAYADLDNDGDLDLVVSNVDHPSFVYRNNAEKLNQANFLRIQLEGSEKNKFGIGTRVKIKTAEGYQMKDYYPSRGYLSSVENTLHFGLGNLQKVDSVWVEWPNGNTQLVTNVSANNILKVKFDTAKQINTSSKINNTVALLEEVNPSFISQYQHQENEYDDFLKETLLPHKLSTLGPSLAVGDVDGNGTDDFYVGGAKGQMGSLFLQDNTGNFSIKNGPWEKDKESEDVSATFFDANNDGLLDLYVVSGGNEFSKNSPYLQDRLYLNLGSGNFQKGSNNLPNMLTSGGIVTSGDYDKDGDVDLFVGGRLVPGSYPVAPRSYILKNTGGAFEDVTQEIAPKLSSFGLITDALWVDYDNDEQLDLIVVGEWTHLGIFKNEGASFEDQSENLGIQEKTKGWWYSIASADIDGDGDPDFVLGNLGLNYKYKASEEAPFDIYYDDFDGNETGDIVLTHNENGEKYPLRGRECSSQQMPFIKEKFKDYESFALANMEEVFGEDKLENALHLEVTTFASIYIQNNQEEPWKITELPRMAQLSSIQDIEIVDLNKDQKLDLIITGNLYNSEVETPRNDASNGLVLLGDGEENFKPITVVESGFFTPKNAKNMTPITIAGSRHFLVVNNNQKLQLFRSKRSL